MKSGSVQSNQAELTGKRADGNLKQIEPVIVWMSVILFMCRKF